MVPTLLDEAKALVLKGDIDAALRKCSDNLNGDFFHDETLFMLGSCFMALGMNGLAAVCTSAAVDARSTRGRGFPEALLNLGSIYKIEHKNDIAAKIWADALKQETLPRERSKILTNIAGLYVNEGQPEQAIEWCDKALKEDPGNHGAAVNRGMACLELGRWREGWEGWRHTYATNDRRRRFYGENIPEWNGQMGRSVIVYGDQGVGDELYYASCLDDMAQVCRKVILDCHPRLESLFKRSFPEFEVHGTRKDMTELPWLRDCDAEYAIGLADLPGHFRNTADEWGDGKAYLSASRLGASETGELRPIEPRALWRSAPEYAPRIGISWTGGTKRTRTDLRSLPLDALEPVLRARPDAQWYSLQYTPDAARQVCELEEHTGIRVAHYPGWVECFDYDRTASFVASLDLVITVCTAAHDLAGGLGVPNWVLVPSRPGWRFQVRGERLPWYASSRLFRQEQDGDWSGVIERVAGELSGLNAARAA